MPSSFIRCNTCGASISHCNHASGSSLLPVVIETIKQRTIESITNTELVFLRTVVANCLADAVPKSDTAATCTELINMINNTIVDRIGRI